VTLAQHHLAKLTAGLAAHYQSLLGEVMSGLEQFPATLSLSEQGLFAIGYYHQRQEFYKKRVADSAESISNNEGAEA
jgi:CRISPR-associated protein Csd1